MEMNLQMNSVKTVKFKLFGIPVSVLKFTSKKFR